MFERLLLRASDAVGPDPTGPPTVNPELIVGPMLIGTVLNVWLYGMQLMQVNTYFRCCTRDSKWIKGLVIFLVLADTVNSVFDIYFTYDYNVRMFGDKIRILTSTWVFNTDPVMTVVISSTVQSFFGWRVQRLTGQTWLACLIYVSAFTQFLCGLGTSIACGIVQEFVKFHSFKSIVIVWLVLAPVTDVAISVALVWFLQRNKTGFAATDDLVAKITRLTVQTGAITAVWAAVDLSIFLCYANNLHLIFNMPLSKLYSNCLLSSLNARREWSTSSASADGGAPTAHRKGGVHITTTTGVHIDNFELNSLGLPYDGGARKTTGGQPTIVDVKRPPLDDGLSLNNLSSTNGSDDGQEDALGDRKKIVDEENAQSDADREAHRVQTQRSPSQRPTHPYMSTVGRARGGRNESNMDWASAL